MKLEKLTPEQESKLHTHRQEWLDKVFKYQLYEKNTLESVFNSMIEMYDFCKLKKPIVLFLDSPYACQIAANFFKKTSQVGSQVEAQVGAQVRAQVRAQVWDQVGAQVRGQVRAQVRAQVGSQVGAQVEAQVGAQVRAQELEFIGFSGYGNLSDFGWLSFYNFFAKESDVKIDKKKDFEKCINYAESAFLSIQLDGLCVVSKFPNYISRNPNNDLHNTKSFAVSFCDGHGQNYVNGRYLEPEIFNNSQTIEGARKEFLSTNNEDIKACIITIIKENFGNSGLMQILNSKLVDEKTVNHTDEYSETLRIYHSKEKHSFLQNSKGELNQPYAWIEMTCPSTGNTYLIDTCPTFTDAIECAKWHRPEIVPNSLPYNWISSN